MNRYFLPFLALPILLAACSSAETAAPAPSPVVDENELRSPSLVGAYNPNGEDDDTFVKSVKVVQNGQNLALHFKEWEQAFTYPLTKTRSGAYVFTSGELSGECDDPGCNYTLKYSGVVYLKKVGSRKVPTLKLTVVTMYPYPESEGDLEGEQSETLRFSKR